MGLKRFIWRSTGIGRGIDTIKNISKERSLIGGIKKTINEDIAEDNPLTSAVYKSGKEEGKKEGYVAASDKYKAKLISQADEFLEQIKDLEKYREEYERLLDECEKEIKRLMDKVDKTNEENALLRELLIRERKLKSLDG